MAGHSKWKNIAHKKGKTDAQRAKLFTKLSREIIVAVREGGANINDNSRLKDVVAKARAGNVPQDNIKRVIEKAAGGGGGANYESISYEGYGPSGVAVIVEAMTDNRNRTASDLRHYFDKYGGNLGATGCVSWSFDKKGVLIVDGETFPDEDKVLEDALDCGADDFNSSDGTHEITTAPDDFSAVRDAMESRGYTYISA
ncbi:MAG: YebC/PmpR family DNA-binding transcriptional regulator, partial [Oscillospiraceae bacterium]|nr:YebC/PmpR family DNA-binding transcriptional regulator [Oscillospiraceae bacterium]